MTWTHLEVVPEDVVRQTVVNLMVSTEGLPALTSKTKCVDHTCSQFTCQHVITVEKQRRNFMDDDEKKKRTWSRRFCSHVTFSPSACQLRVWRSFVDVTDVLPIFWSTVPLIQAVLAVLVSVTHQ